MNQFLDDTEYEKNSDNKEVDFSYKEISELSDATEDIHAESMAEDEF